MLSLRTILCIIGFVVSQTGAYLCLRLASQRTGMQLYGMFLLATSIGFGSPVCLTLALRNSNPNLIYAFCIGGAFFVLQLASSLVFRQPLSATQWAGILVIGLGLVLVQLKGLGSESISNSAQGEERESGFRCGDSLYREVKDAQGG